MVGAVYSSASPVYSLVRHAEAVPLADSTAAQPAPASSVCGPQPCGGGSSLLSPSNLLAAQAQTGESGSSDSGKKDSSNGSKSAGSNGQLSDDEKAQVEKLKALDREVRAHERAHASTGGNLAGAPSYSYQKGPDGQQYAVDGEVKIDATPVKNDPDATITKMQRVIAAALAPAQPSGQDRAVAAQARAQLAQAQVESLKKGQVKLQGGDTSPGGQASGPAPSSDQPILSLIA